MHQPARQSTNPSAHDRMHAVPHVSQALQPARPMVATRCPWGSRAPGRQRGKPADLGGANAGAGGQVVHAGLHDAGRRVEGRPQRQHIRAVDAPHLRSRPGTHLLSLDQPPLQPLAVQHCKERCLASPPPPGTRSALSCRCCLDKLHPSAALQDVPRRRGLATRPWGRTASLQAWRVTGFTLQPCPTGNNTCGPAPADSHRSPHPHRTTRDPRIPASAVRGPARGAAGVRAGRVGGGRTPS